MIFKVMCYVAVFHIFNWIFLFSNIQQQHMYSNSTQISFVDVSPSFSVIKIIIITECKYEWTDMKLLLNWLHSNFWTVHTFGSQTTTFETYKIELLSTPCNWCYRVHKYSRKFCFLFDKFTLIILTVTKIVNNN